MSRGKLPLDWTTRDIPILFQLSQSCEEAASAWIRTISEFAYPETGQVIDMQLAALFWFCWQDAKERCPVSSRHCRAAYGECCFPRGAGC
eukprot:671357-Amphidinium_carterae.1